MTDIVVECLKKDWLKERNIVFYSFFADSNFAIQQSELGVKPDKVVTKEDLSVALESKIKEQKEERQHLTDIWLKMYGEESGVGRKQLQARCLEKTEWIEWLGCCVKEAKK